MAVVGPFASAPRLAVGCSGGGDSLALVLLADDWARQRGGTVFALTVDHGLRPGSAIEANAVARWMKRRGIAHATLPWLGAKPKANIAATARAARYGLLLDCCRRHGVGDLLLAHQLEDQAETFLLRLARGSGADGLAAMAPVVLADGVRLLRPLLGVPRERLRVTLRGEGQDWIEDPSNESAASARARMRKLLPSLAREGLTVARLAATAARMGEVRAALEAATAAALTAAAVIDPAGYARLNASRLQEEPKEIALRVLSRLLMQVGGTPLPARLERLERLLAAIRAGRLAAGRTLAGCRLLPSRGQVLICREPAAVSAPAALRAGERLVWDGRFALSLGAPRDQGSFRVAALGLAGWRAVAARRAELRHSPIPGAVRPTLPALCDLDGVLTVPHLDYRRTCEAPILNVEFLPLPRPLAPAISPI